MQRSRGRSRLGCRDIMIHQAVLGELYYCYLGRAASRTLQIYPGDAAPRTPRWDGCNASDLPALWGAPATQTPSQLDWPPRRARRPRWHGSAAASFYPAAAHAG